MMFSNKIDSKWTERESLNEPTLSEAIEPSPLSYDRDIPKEPFDLVNSRSQPVSKDRSLFFEDISTQIKDTLIKEEQVGALRALELILSHSEVTPISFFVNGGEGFIFLATKDDGREYVFKCLKNPPNEALFCPEDSIGSYLREVQIPNLLCHPAIPQYEDVLRLEPDSGLPIIGILRSKIQGQSLKEIIDSRRSTSPSEVLELLKKTLPILAHIHDQTDNRTGHKIVHSDIKPANIILDIDGNPKLIDFGVARQFQPGHTFQHTVGMRGTLDYCPPEQLTGGGVPASDIYSLGVTVIHALLGFMPPELRENWRKSEPFTIPKDIEISKEFTLILRKMIHPNLEWRYQNADEVLDDLQNPSLLVTQSSSWYSWIFGDSGESL